MSRILVPILLALGAGLAFWSLAGDPEVAARPEAPAVDSAPAEAAVPEVRLRAPDDAGAGGEVRSALAPTSGEPEPGPGPEQGQDETRPQSMLTGTVTILERDGTETRDASGTFELLLWTGDSATGEAVAFEDGSFQVELEPGGSWTAVTVQELVRDGRRLSVEAPEERAPMVSALAVRATVPPSSTLAVVDAETGAHLAGVELSRSWFQASEHPGTNVEATRLARGLTSPVELDPYSGALQGKVLVRAEGYAWASVDVDFERGGDWQVGLRREALLTVEVVGVEAGSGSRLLLRTGPSRRPLVELGLEADRIVSFDGLAPGEFDVAVEIGERYGSKSILASERTMLQEGVQTVVRLELTAPPSAQVADLGGSLHVAEEWGAAPRLLRVKLLNAVRFAGAEPQSIQLSGARSLRPGFRSYDWSARGLQVGTYELELQDPRISFAVELPPEGDLALDLVAPPPAELLVQILEDSSGDPVTDVQLSYNAKRPEVVGGGSLDVAEWNAERGGYIVRAPAMEVELALWSPDYQPVFETVDLAAGARSHTLRVQRTSGLRLVLRDGETVVAFPDDWYLSPQAASGSGRVLMSQHGREERTFTLSEPGTYVIEIPELPGYRPVPPQRVTVDVGPFTEHVIQLERL